MDFFIKYNTLSQTIQLVQDMLGELICVDKPMLVDQQSVKFISSVRTRDAVKMTYLGRWLIGTNDEEESWEYLLMARFD